MSTRHVGRGAGRSAGKKPGLIRRFWRWTRWPRRLVLAAGVALLVWVWFTNPYIEAASPACPEAIDTPPNVRTLVVAKTPGYARPESSTYLTLPVRYLADQSEEYARALRGGGAPSAFPYFRSMAQYWRYDYRVFKIAQAKYGVRAADHVLLVAIGAGVSADSAFKGMYESSIRHARGSLRRADRGRLRAVSSPVTVLRVRLRGPAVLSVARLADFGLRHGYARLLDAGRRR
jgi:hypothetical protein